MVVPNIPNAPLWARQLIQRINVQFTARDLPTVPVKLPEFVTDEMPNAADYSGAQLWNTTISRVCVSDGTNWLRQDNGSAV
jgi:hypothetical protein